MILSYSRWVSILFLMLVLSNRVFLLRVSRYPQFRSCYQNIHYVIMGL
jgi:hypothetical protein